MEDSSGYVLFGAGTTGMAALRYYGSDKVNAVIDNDAQNQSAYDADSSCQRTDNASNSNDNN